MGNSGKSGEKLEKVAESAKNWLKVGKSGEKWESGEMWGKVANSSE